MHYTMEVPGAGLWLSPEEFAAVSEKYVLAGEPGAGDRLGHGSYGAVASAIERATNARVALKWLVLADADAAAVALRELLCLQGLRRAAGASTGTGTGAGTSSGIGIVQLRDAFCTRVRRAAREPEELDTLVLVTAAAFDDLGNTLTRAHRVRAAVPAVGFARQLLRGAAFLHAAGVAHLDIKPQNVLVYAPDLGKASGSAGSAGDANARDAGGASARAAPESDNRVALCDFGLADVGVSDWRMVQTVWWRAPEYVLGGRRPHSRVIGPRALAAAADVWSIGCVIYELLGAAAGAAERVLFPQSGGPAALFRARLEVVGPPPGATAVQIPQIFARLEERIEEARHAAQRETQSLATEDIAARARLRVADAQLEDADFTAIHKLWIDPAPTLLARAAALVAAAPEDDRPALAALAALLPRLLAFDPADRIRASAALASPPFRETPADLVALDTAGQVAGARFSGFNSQFATLPKNATLPEIMRQIRAAVG